MYYCENCFEEELKDYIELYNGTILCCGCDAKRLEGEHKTIPFTKYFY